MSILLALVICINYNMQKVNLSSWMVTHNYSSLGTNVWCGYFTMYEFKKIMQQKEDTEFAELLSRLHIGKHSNGELKLSLSTTITMSTIWTVTWYTSFLSYKKKVKSYIDMMLQNTSGEILTITTIDITPIKLILKHSEKQLHTAICKKMTESTGWFLNTCY